MNSTFEVSNVHFYYKVKLNLARTDGELPSELEADNSSANVRLTSRLAKYGSVTGPEATPT